MSNTGIVRAKSAGVVGAVVLVAATVAAALSFSSTGEANPGDVRAQLECGSEKFVATSVTHDGVTKEARTPVQQARDWASAAKMAKSRLRADGQRVTYQSEERTDVAHTDRAGKIIAILTYEKRDNIGWVIESIVECA